MLTNETISKLNEMHLGTMAAGFTAQLTDTQFQSLSFEERFSILVDAEWSARKSNRLAKLIMSAAGYGAPSPTILPTEIITAIEDCGFFESIPLWAVTLIGGLFVWVLSFVMILTVYGRFFKLYMYTAIAPIPLSSFAGEPSQSVGISFLKSYAAVCLEGAIIVLACVIFSVFAATPPSFDPDAAAITMVWGYVGELIFGMLVLTGTIKMSDRVVHEMIGV